MTVYDVLICVGIGWITCVLSVILGYIIAKKEDTIWTKH
jgi:hypothetical protein